MRSDLHRRGEVERCLTRSARDRRHDLAARQLVVRKARHFRCRTPERPHPRPHAVAASSAAARTGNAMLANCAAPGREADRQRRAGERGVERRTDARGAEQRDAGARRAHRRPDAKLPLGATSTSCERPIVSIAARGGTDVAGVARRARGRRERASSGDAMAGDAGAGENRSGRMPASRVRIHRCSRRVKAARRAGSIINRGARDLDLLTVTAKGPEGLRERGRSRAPKRAIVDTLHADLSGPRDPRRGRHQPETRTPTPSTSGSSIRSTARRISCTAFRNTACRSRSLHRGVITQGVIYDPVRNDLFTATRGRGAFLNDRRIRVSRRQHLRDCLIGTGFPFRDGSYLDTYLADDARR